MTTPPSGPWPPQPPQAPRRWGPPPPPWGPPPQNSSNRSKWILGGLALLVVVVVTVTTTLLLTRDGSNGSNSPIASPPPSESVNTSDIASADDRGPVGIITEDPTCAAWEPVARTLSEKQQNGWAKRDPTIPSSDWTPQQRSQYEEVGRAMINAADQTVALAKLTPHRVMRELYEQSIAYWRAYSDSLATYTSAHDSIALVANSTSGAIVWICAAITYGSAAARSPLVSPGVPPISVARAGDPAEPRRFMEQPSNVCNEWASTSERFNADTDRWAEAVDPNLPASQWSTEQEDLFTSITAILQTNAGQLQNLGAISQNPTLNDFASLAAQYQRAYVQAIPSYTPADNYLNSTASELVVAVEQACQAAKG